jgi:hypothetical protein
MSEFIGSRFRERMPRLAVIAAGGSLLISACTEGALTGDPTDSEQRFMQEVNAVVVSPGEVASVPELRAEFRDDYRDLHVVEQQDKFDDDRDNALTFRPNRYKTGFDKGDGSGADSVCEDLSVPADTRYVFAVQDSDEEAWISFDQDGDTVRICYPASGNPDTVAAWGSAESR